MSVLAKRKLLGEYRIGRTIGEGAFSKVKVATHKLTNEKVAIKIIKKEEDKEKNGEKEKKVENIGSSVLSTLSKEVKLLMRLDHPNVIKLHEVIDAESELYIIMDYASGGELIDYIAAKGSLSEKEGRKFFRQLVAAIDHCHLAGVIHRDLKLENMLLSGDKNLMLSDFGLGRTIFSADQFLNTFCGTPLYAAPELVSGIKYIGPSADIWSLGIVLFIMISGKPPFKCDSISELYAQIKGVKYTCPPHFSTELRNLLTKLLVKDPTKRVTMDDLRMDTWLNIGENSPPPRILPKVLASSRAPGTDLDSEIDKMVSNVQQQDGFTVYQFRKIEASENKKSDDSLNKPVEAYAETPSVAVPKIEAVSPSYDEGYNSATTSAKVHGSRRGSLASTLSKMNPFGSRDNATSGKIPPSSQQSDQRQRSASVDPNSVFYKTAYRSKAAPTSAEPVCQLANEQNDSGASHGRRHSVATPVPAVAAPVNVQLKPAPVPTRAFTDASAKSSGHKPGSNHLQTPDQNNMLAPTQNHANLGNRRRSIAPSMEQIAEGEEATFSKPSAPHSRSPTITDVHSTANGHSRRTSLSEVLGFGRHESYGDEIRTVRYSTQLQSVAHKDPVALMKQLESVLQNSFIFSKQEFGENGLSTEKRGKWVYNCKFSTPASGDVIFEIEIVKVWLLPMLAVKTKRLGGDAISYKNAYDRVMNALKG